jgi:hypothetical protein
MKPVPLTVCTMFEKPCRHCSNENKLEIVREGTIADMNFKKHEKIVPLGQFCNDAGKWIADMHYCPVVWGNYLLSHAKPAGVKKVMKEKKVTKKWKVRADGDTRRTAEVLHVGQQRLRV